MMFFAIEAMWTVCETVVPILPSPVVGTRNSRSILGMEIAAIMQAIPQKIFEAEMMVAFSISDSPILQSIICTMVVTNAFTNWFMYARKTPLSLSRSPTQASGTPICITIISMPLAMNEK